jgi:hypothetical protein
MGYYIKFTRLSMKYFLILWVCSAINGACLVPPITYPEPFNSHYECVEEGYATGLNMVYAMDRQSIEMNRLFVAFNCQQESVI